MSKRGRVEIEDELSVSEVGDIGSNKRVCGVITQLSPIKKGKRNSHVQFFDGKICDEKKSLRMVCFNSRLHSLAEAAKESKSKVIITNCNVKEYGGEFEIVLADTSNMLSSTEKLLNIEKVDNVLLLHSWTKLQNLNMLQLWLR